MDFNKVYENFTRKQDQKSRVVEKKMNSKAEIELAPLRSLDDFILSQSRFQIPEYQNVDKFKNRIVSNLLYYQTNYALSSVILFSLITFMNPFKMILGMSTMAILFGLLYYSVERQDLVRQMKREHPTMTMMLTLLSGHFIIYQSGCVLVFITGVLLPILFTILHAALRLRNIKNKITSVVEVARVGRKTPMAVLLQEWGVEPDLKYLS